jgi:hypothetical protein
MHLWLAVAGIGGMGETIRSHFNVSVYARWHVVALMLSKEFKLSYRYPNRRCMQLVFKLRCSHPRWREAVFSRGMSRCSEGLQKYTKLKTENLIYKKKHFYFKNCHLSYYRDKIHYWFYIYLGFTPREFWRVFFYQIAFCERSLQRNFVLQHWQQRSQVLRLVSCDGLHCKDGLQCIPSGIVLNAMGLPLTRTLFLKI